MLCVYAEIDFRLAVTLTLTLTGPPPPAFPAFLATDLLLGCCWEAASAGIACRDARHQVMKAPEARCRVKAEVIPEFEEYP